MGWKINLGKLRGELNRSTGVIDHTWYALADRVVEYCRENKLDTPYGTVFVPSHFIPTVHEQWCGDLARAYFTEKLMGNAVPDDDAIPVWLKVETPEFGIASANLFAAHFITAQDTETTRQMYMIEDWASRQVLPVYGSKQTQRVVMLSKAIPVLDLEGVGITEKLIDAMVLQYAGRAKVIAPPALLGQPDDDNWCLHRATVRADASVAWPLINQFVSRLDDPEALCAFLHGIYSRLNLGRQMMYIDDMRGEGGKSAIIAMLMEQLFGTLISAAYPANAISAKSTFANSAFVDKLLLVAGDNKNPWILHSAVLKELSGSDPSFMNRKYHDPRMMRFQCRVIVMGNCQPALIHDAHNTSRTLWLTLAPLNLANGERDPLYAKKCIAELPGFLAHCAQCYAERCPSGNHYAIEVNQQVKDKMARRIAVCEAEHSVPFEEHFTADSTGKVTSVQFAKVARELRLDANKSEDLRSWILAMVPGAAVEIPNLKRPTQWVITGIRPRTARDDMFDAAPIIRVVEPQPDDEDDSINEME